MPTIADVRSQYPQYNDMSDDQLARALHNKFYSDMPFADFSSKIGMAAPQQEAPKPPERQSVSVMPAGFEQLAQAGLGMKQGIDALAQMAARATGWGVPQTEAAMAPKPTDESVGASLSRGAGQALLTAPIAGLKAVAALPKIIQGAGLGGLGGVLDPVYNAGEDFWQQKRNQLGVGATVGGLTTGLAGIASRMLAPKTAPAVKQLMAEGVTPTPGQVAGGTAMSVEDAASRIPLVGDAVQAGRARAIKDYNRAIYNRALAPIGVQYPKDGPIGREGIAKVGDMLSDSYEAALANSVPNPLDFTFQRNVSALGGMVPKGKASDFVSTLQTNIFTKVSPAGTLTPTAAKEAERDLGKVVRDYIGSPNGDDRVYARAVGQVQAELRNLVARNNPQTAPIIQATNRGWATLAQIENAGAGLGAKEGVFTGAQFTRSVKGSDKSLRDRMFAGGKALNQDIAEAGKAVLSDSMPETGARLIPALTVGSLLHATGTLPLAGAASLAYTPLGQRMVAGLLASRTPGMVTAGSRLGEIAPYLAVPATGLFGL